MYGKNASNINSIFINGGSLDPITPTSPEYLTDSFGYLPDQDTTDTNLIIYPGAKTSTYPFPTSATTMTISSTSANDTSGGTGAQTVLIEWLDSSFARNFTTVTMNGLLASATTLVDAFRINRMTVVTVGSGQVNAGVVYIGDGTITGGVPANVYGLIQANEGQSQFGWYTVPAGVVNPRYELAITKIESFAGGNPNARANIVLQTRKNGEGWLTRKTLLVASGGPIIIETQLHVLPGTDIVSICRLVEANNTTVGLEFNIEALLVPSPSVFI